MTETLSEDLHLPRWRANGGMYMRRLVLGIGLALVVASTASAHADDPCAAQRDLYIALVLNGPPQDKATYDKLAAALDAVFTCNNPGVSLHDFGDLDQFFATPIAISPIPVPPTPTVGP